MTHEPPTTASATTLEGRSARADAVAERTVTVLLYSDDSDTRAAVRRAIGRRASRDTPYITWREVATAEAMFEAVGAGGIDLVVLDGETAKVGGFGLAREIKDTFFTAPPVLLLVARVQDAWLAAWSQADGVVPFPLDPAQLADAVAALLRLAES